MSVESRKNLFLGSVSIRNFFLNNCSNITPANVGWNLETFVFVLKILQVKILRKSVLLLIVRKSVCRVYPCLTAVNG